MAPTNGNKPTEDNHIAAPDEILEVVPDLLFEFTADGSIAALHAGNPKDLVMPPSEIVGQSLDDILPQTAAEKFDTGLREVVDTGEETTVEYLLVIDDELRRFVCRLIPLESGHILGQVRNITEQWQAQTRLRKSENRYRTLVNNLPGLVYRCHADEEWTPIFISPTVEEMLGYSHDDFHADGLTLNAIIHPEDREEVRTTVMSAVDDGVPFRLSYRIIGADGEIHHVAERGQAVYADGEPDYLDGVIFDVTEMHQLRQRVLVNSKMAAVGNLAAGVAHEINNPLTIALANLEYVAEELDAVSDTSNTGSSVNEALEDVTMAVGKTQQGIDRVRGIIDNLRTFTDAAESRANHVDLLDLVDWAIRRKRERIDCDSRIEAELESVPPVWASEVGVVQVVWNLLDNALEAVDRADVDDDTVRVSLHGDDDRAILEITDRGPGMAPEIAKRAFEPFYTTKQVGQGPGLGLFVCQGLVEGMDGTIDLDTTEGEGTTVRVMLPASLPAGRDAE